MFTLFCCKINKIIDTCKYSHGNHVNRIKIKEKQIYMKYLIFC